MTTIIYQFQSLLEMPIKDLLSFFSFNSKSAEIQFYVNIYHLLAVGANVLYIKACRISQFNIDL